MTPDIEEPKAARLWALAELFALTGLVIAQPVLEVVGRSPDMFLFRRADRLDIVALAAAVTVLPALTIWAVEELAGLVSATVRRHLHLVAITGLFVLLAFEVIKATTGLRGPRLAAVAAAGGLFGGAVRRSVLAAAVAAVPDPGPAGLRAAVPTRLADLGAGPAGAGADGPEARRRRSRPATGRRW